MILHARDNGVPFGWVSMDSAYGNLPWLRNDLDAEGITYIADIHRDTWVWLKLPKIGIPERNLATGAVLPKQWYWMENQLQSLLRISRSRFHPHNGFEYLLEIRKEVNSGHKLHLFPCILGKMIFQEDYSF
jgi:hypothetical protein